MPVPQRPPSNVWGNRPPQPTIFQNRPVQEGEEVPEGNFNQPTSVFRTEPHDAISGVS